MVALKKFYEDKPLLPDAFTANNRVEAIQGMYVPFWLFDADIDAQGSYKGSRSMAVDTGDAIMTSTSYYICHRQGCMKFERIPVDGSKKMDDAFMESIAPFDYNEMVPFATGYMAGYLADKYDVDADAAVLRADERINKSAELCLAQTVNGYDSVQPENDCAFVKGASGVHYAMVPVWILTTRYKDEPYTFMMNGQTGEVVGSLPIDEGKLRNRLLIAFAITVVVAFVALYSIL